MTPALIPWPEDQPTVSMWPTAARAFGIGRSTAYRLAADGRFPVRVQRVGGRWICRTSELRRALGMPTLREPPR